METGSGRRRFAPRGPKPYKESNDLRALTKALIRHSSVSGTR